jgi:ApaG protein
MPMSATNAYSATTKGIEVIAEPMFRPDQSDPEGRRWFWSYRITIINHSDMTVQVQSRYWKIIDANGKIEEVRGPGVVGEQPVLGPDDSYQYMSGCPLSTSSGTMEGHYLMMDDEGVSHTISIPAFSLDLPDYRRTLN